MLNSLEIALSRKLVSNHGVLIHTFWDKCNKPLSNGVLFFTVAGQQKSKPIIVTTANGNPDFPDQKLTNFIRLNSMGQIPEECKIDFIVTDENDKTQLYDIYVFSSEMPIEQLEADAGSVVLARFQEFLVQILNDRPFVETLEFNAVAFDGTKNFFEDGQFNNVTIIENPLIATHGNYGITPNVDYQILPNISQKNPIVRDILSIDNINDSSLDGRPAKCLTIIARNQNQLQPQSRKLNLNFFNSSVIFQTKVDLILFIKTNVPMNIAVELNSLDVAYPLQSFSTSGLGSWERIKVVIQENFLTTPALPITISLVLPQNNFTLSITNIGLYKASDVDIPYAPTTNVSPTPNFPSPVMNSPIGFITMPMTVGRITEYLDDGIAEDKPSEIYADGRAVKRSGEYVYNKDYFAKVPIRIPYQYLYDKIGSAYGSGKDFINAVDMSNFNGGFDYCDIIFHTNDSQFSVSPNFLIGSKINHPFGDPLLISRGYNNNTDYDIQTYFLNESDNLYSLGILVDSGYCSVFTDTEYTTSKKHQIGFTRPNNNQANNKKILTSLSVCKTYQKNFVVIGEENLPETLVVTTTAGRIGQGITASMARLVNKYIDADNSDTSKDFSLRYAIKQNPSATDTLVLNTFRYNAVTTTVPSHTVIYLHNVNFDTNNVLSKKQIIVPMKYQIAGQYAVGFKIIKFAANDLRQGYFELKIKNKTYGCWFNTGNDTPSFSAAAIAAYEDLIEIKITEFTKAGVVKAICDAINSYIFCIPDLRGTYNYATGQGVQSSKLNNIGIDWSNVNNPADMKHFLSNDLKNYINFIPSINNCILSSATSKELASTANTATFLPVSVDHENFTDAERVLTRKYISLC